MSVDPITRRIIEATRVRFDACAHAEIVDPPPGKHLRVCLDCGCRLIECDRCDAKTFARADIAESEWTEFGWETRGGGKVRMSLCPDCSDRR